MNATAHLRKLGSALCLIAGLAAFGSGFAQEANLEVTNAVFQEVEVAAPDGTVTRKLVPAVKVVPGQDVVYEISFRNTGGEEATDLAVDNPLPRALVFVEAATDPTAVSVDGGEHFGKLAELTVTGTDGEERAAQPSDITNLRWVVARLAPGATGKVTFRARVK